MNVLIPTSATTELRQKIFLHSFDSERKVHCLWGKIQAQTPDKVYRKGKNYGSPFYRLKVVIEGEIIKMNVFRNLLERKQIWEELDQGNFWGKEYLFFCHNYWGSYSLVDWEEI